MSSCPNCGSADDHMPHGATCRTNEAVNEATYERDQLIRELREERDALRLVVTQNAVGLAVEVRDAERDRIADLVHERRGTARGVQGLPDYTKGYNAACDEIVAAIAIRSNEHRSNT